MRTIRRHTFETNSSSTHSVTILSDKEYNDFVQQKSFFSRDTDEIITLEDVKNAIKNEVESIPKYKENLKKHAVWQKYIDDAMGLKDVSESDIELIWNWFMNTYEDGNYFEFNDEDDSDLEELNKSLCLNAKQKNVLKYFKKHYYYVWSYDTFGGYDYEMDDDSRTIDGVNIHVLSYYGYN